MVLNLYRRRNFAAEGRKKTQRGRTASWEILNGNFELLKSQHFKMV